MSKSYSNKVVFTNGCYDILHLGHIDLLTRARTLGTRLIVGINSDNSVRHIKGSPRPFISQDDRKAILESLRCVDEVIVFDETTPLRLIEEIQPQILVKGGDWKPEEIIGADFVIKNGGEVVSLPLKAGYSTSSIIERIQSSNNQNASDNNRTSDSLSLITNMSLVEHQTVFEQIISSQIPTIQRCAEMILGAFRTGNKVLLCGNGGSASDAQHIAAEFVGRYEHERAAMPAIALTTDTSALTAIGNDYGFDNIFARQVEALAKDGDVLIGISTSGNSPNVISAVMMARRLGCKTIGLTGAKGKKLASLCDISVLVPSERTARIQEAHITIGHLFCELVESRILENREQGVSSAEEIS